jgi:hypothetical protein
MMDDDRRNERIRAAAADYHEPPETPREAMWERICAAREGSDLRVARLRRPGRGWLGWGVGIAAVLAMGIAIGRMSAPGAGPRAAAVASGATDAPHAPGLAARPSTDAAYRVAAAGHLDRVEAYLIQFRREARTGSVDAGLRAPARQLLSNTRLLLASPAADDPALRTVLDDVELVLAQIARYAAEPSGEDLRFIDDGIDQRGLLLELRTVVTTASPAGLAQGAI